MYFIIFVLGLFFGSAATVLFLLSMASSKYNRENDYLKTLERK